MLMTIMRHACVHPRLLELLGTYLSAFLEQELDRRQDLLMIIERMRTY